LYTNHCSLTGSIAKAPAFNKRILPVKHYVKKQLQTDSGQKQKLQLLLQANTVHDWTFSHLRCAKPKISRIEEILFVNGNNGHQV
jgi:hypothetical protein